ncbi:MAG: signal recognition particle-docking protein FtsY [Chloroflexi bacterium]|nr:signal recognition particle-docking protein FtsY [Chloroflexota bacterium]
MLKRLFGRGDEARPVDQAQAEAAAVGLERSRKSLGTRLAEVFGPVDISDRTWEDLEDQLIKADVGVRTAIEMVADLRAKARLAGARRASELPELMQQVMVKVLEGAADARPSSAAPPKPFVILMVGVNGSGKTTTIAKLAELFRSEGRSVLLVAGDTFRAAAIDQLQVWGERLGVPVAAGQPDGDPGAVVFDALSSRQGKAADLIIVDTAGRLHTQHNLMAELVKVRSVIAGLIPDAPHETLLVLDATTGQNGLLQAKAFADAVAVSGLVLSKLDSSAKGGVAFAVTRELGLPIQYIGTGERLGDLLPFDPASYAAGLLGRMG